MKKKRILYIFIALLLVIVLAAPAVAKLGEEIEACNCIFGGKDLSVFFPLILR